MSSLQVAVPPLLYSDAAFSNVFAGSQSVFSAPTSVPTLPVYPTDAVNKLYVDTKTTPGGSPNPPNQAVQYNDNGGFGGSPDFTWDSLANTLNVTNIESTNILSASMSVTNAPVNPTDVTNKQYVDSLLISPAGLNTQIQYNNNGVFGGTTGVTWDGTTLNATLITSPQVPVNPSDLVNKLYVDSLSGSPGGSNTQMQFNNNGVFGGTTGLTWNGTTLSATLITTPQVPVANDDVVNKLYADSLSTNPGGLNTQIQFNNSGVFGGTTGLTWNGTTLDATLITTPQVPVNANDVTNKQYVDNITGSAPGLPLNSVQFNLGNVFTGSSDFTWDNTLKQLVINGDISADNLTSTSDRNAKENIKLLDSERCLDLITNIDCYSYNLIGKENESVGVMADQLEDIGLGNIVLDGPKHKSVAYMQLLTIAIAAIKQLNENQKKQTN